MTNLGLGGDRRTSVVGMIVSAIVMAATGTHRPLWLDNATEQPASIGVGSAKFLIPARSRAEVSVPKGLNRMLIETPDRSETVEVHVPWSLSMPLDNESLLVLNLFGRNTYALEVGWYVKK